jgi:hypothetical protein
MRLSRWLLLSVLMACGGMAAAEDLAKDVMLVFDNSGSMRKVDPEFLATRAVGEFIEALQGDTRVAVIIFDEKVNMAVPLTPLADTGRAAVVESLKQVNYRGRWTNSPAAVEQAIYDLKNSGREGVEKLVVFMTDGIVDTGDPAADKDKSRWMREELAEDAARHGIKFFTIAFTESADFQLIQSLATKTGGEYYRALKAEDLHDAFVRVGDAVASLEAPEAPVPVEPAAVEPQPAPVPGAPEPPAAVPTPEPGPAPDVVAPATPDQAAEEFAKAAGVPKEELDKLGEGQAMVVPPAEPQTDKMLLALVALGVLILGVIAVVVVVKRRAPMAVAPGAAAVPAKDEDDYVPQAFLNDLQGNTGSSRHTLGAKPSMLGRVGGSDSHLQYIVINQTTVGRRHALIEYKDFCYWIIDQGSVNGTFVNGEKITEGHRLKHGDRVRLHKCEFEFLMPEVADAGKTIFSGGSEKTVFAGAEPAPLAVVAAAPPVVPVAPSAPAPEPEPDADAEEEDAFDVTGGAFAEAAAPAAPVAAEPVDFAGGTIVLEPDEAPTDFHDRDTLIRDMPEAPAPAMAPPLAAPEEDDREDMTLDSFISTTVLEAQQMAALQNVGSEDATIKSAKYATRDPEPVAAMPPPSPAAAPPPPPPAPAPAPAAAPVEDELSLDDFIEETALGDAGAPPVPRAPEPADDSDRTAFLDESDRTLMPSQVPQRGKPTGNTHLGDTTAFGAEDLTLPPKR